MDLEIEIKGSLITLLDGINKSDAEVILRETEQLEKLAAEGRDSLAPQLVHFLERRSYAKALALLEGATGVPAGVCAPRPKP